MPGRVGGAGLQRCRSSGLPTLANNGGVAIAKRARHLLLRWYQWWGRQKKPDRRFHRAGQRRGGTVTAPCGGFVAVVFWIGVVDAGRSANRPSRRAPNSRLEWFSVIP